MEKERNEIDELKSQISNVSWKLDILENNYVHLYSTIRPPLYKVGDEITISGNTYKWLVIDYNNFAQEHFFNHYLSYPRTVNGVFFDIGFAKSKGPYKYAIKLEGLDDVVKEVFEDQISNHHETKV